jgi:hypothetical protein
MPLCCEYELQVDDFDPKTTKHNMNTFINLMVCTKTTWGEREKGKHGIAFATTTMKTP